MNKNPLLTIAIPTWNRADFLKKNLVQLSLEIGGAGNADVELLVSDNCSEDNTLHVVNDAIAGGLVVRYIRNVENIGSDANIAQCFNLALGKYVLILGDDDLLVDGALMHICQKLNSSNCGVLCLRTYGFDVDFRAEYPPIRKADSVFSNAGEFLVAAGPLSVLISACIINKEILSGVNAMQFCGGNLVQVHLVFKAAMMSKINIMTGQYLIAYKRNNWGYYDFAKVFVTELGSIVDKYQAEGLDLAMANRLEVKMLFTFFPFYIFKQRLDGSGDIAATRMRFQQRYAGKLLFNVWVYPILVLPRYLAVIWGGVATIIGRCANGDMPRAAWFLWSRLARVRLPWIMDKK